MSLSQIRIFSVNEEMNFSIFYEKGDMKQNLIYSSNPFFLFCIYHRVNIYIFLFLSLVLYNKKEIYIDSYNR